MEETTLVVRRNYPNNLRLNPKMKWLLYGFVGNIWIDLPFETMTQAQVYCVEHGWNMPRIQD